MSYSAIAACVLKPETLDEVDAKIVHALAQCNMNVCEVSKKLTYQRNTINYHINRVKKITGLDPRNFFDLGELYTIALEILGDEYELL